MSSDFRVYRDLQEVPADFGPCALTIGNFDGVHAGHRQLLRRVVHLARERGWKPAVLTFDPHPTRIVAPERAPRLMTTPGERCEFFRELGIQETLLLPFDASMALWPPEYFIREAVVGKLGARAILVGRDFRFGHKHEGDTALMAKLGRELGYITELVAPVTFRGHRISSSIVREFVEEGRVALACRYLTRPFAVRGPVVKGQGIGSRQTVPTLNLEPGEVVPKTGVYITRTYDLDSARSWNSVTNVGFRPTFGGDSLTIESFLLEPLDAAPARIRVDFHFRLRDERKFETPLALKEQIQKDVSRALEWFARSAVRAQKHRVPK